MAKGIVGALIIFGLLLTPCFANNQRASEELVREGFLALQSGQVERGIELLESAIEIDPNNHVALATLAQAYADFENDYERALSLFEKSLALKKDYDMALFGRGLVYQAMGMRDKAREEFEKTIAATKRPNVKRIAKQALEKLG